MTLKSAFLAILLTSLASAGIGASIGGCIGWLAPDYYRLVFRQPDNANLNPLEIGMGLGMTQGLAAGVLLSVLGMGLVVWREQHRLRNATLGDDPSDTAARPRIHSGLRIHLVWSAVTAIVTGLAAVLAFVIGGIIAQEQLYHRQSDRKLNKLSTILDAPAYAGVSGERGSAGRVYLTGSLNEMTAVEALRQQLINSFGTEEADDMLRGVDIISR